MKERERHLPDSCWTRQITMKVDVPLQLMKATVLAESSVFILFHHDLSAPAMSTDMSQVGVSILIYFYLFLNIV